MPAPHDHAGHEGHEDGARAKADREILGQPSGSGTSWLPQGSPLHDHAVHATLGAWSIMTHGEMILRYNAQNFNNPGKWPKSGTGVGASFYPGLERGDAGFDAPNWAMVSAERGLGRGRLMLRAMMSLDPLTLGRRGYPLLFQTGEGLVDRQHAHDLFMELGALYSHPVGEHSQVFAYLALPGEPALGPTAFMHRPSAGNNPDAPLAHHSQDATHITHGVATLGWIHRGLKIDASAFNGREPDADRWDLETGAFDSYSLRVTGNLGDFSLHGSGAYLNEPEPGEHGSVLRATASASHNKTLAAASGANWSSTVIVGGNFGHHGGATRSILGESALTGRRASTWARWESLERTATELNLDAADPEFHWVHALTAGLGGRVATFAGVEAFVGGQLTWNLVGEGGGELREAYGPHPLAGQVFVKIRPAGGHGGRGAHEGHP